MISLCTKKLSKGTILALTLMFVPLALLLSLTVAHSISFGNGYSLQAQHRARAFYLAESGINLAYRLLQTENFSADTRDIDNNPRDPDDPQFMQNHFVGLGLSYDESDGSYRWQWAPGDPVNESYTRSGLEEEFRFSVARPTPEIFRIECRARVGSQLESQVLEGEVTSMLNYVVFDNGDFADFTRSHDERVTGDIHANGDIFLRPFETAGFMTAFESTSNPKLELTVNGMTAAGKIYRHTDPWGNADDGGTVEIANALTGKRNIMVGHEQGYSGPGNAFDSDHPSWAAPVSDPNGALAKWDSAVSDRTLGAQTKDAAIRESFGPNGYYANRAGLSIDSSTSGSWVSDVSFFNESEERLVTVKEIDVSELSSSGSWPANGLLYSEEPVRLVNGHQLAGDLTVVSSSTVYIKGDFNKKYPTAAAKASATPMHKKAAILTPDRIYRTTSSYQDKSASDLPNILELLGGANRASDPPLFIGDDNNVLETNGAFVDGKPTTDARSWVDDPANPYYVPSNGVSVMGLSFNRKVKQVPSGPTQLKVAYAQADQLLEDLQDVRLVGTGAIGHLRIAEMANFDNSNASKTVTPWIAHTFYIPPKQTIDGKPGKEFEFDPELSIAGGLTGAPFAPKLGRRVKWSRLHGS